MAARGTRRASERARTRGPAGDARGRVALARALSKLGLASRREAEAAIRDGRVRVAGRVERDPRRLVVPERVELALDERSAAPFERVVIAFHKPRGTLVTRRDPEGRPTVYDLLGEPRQRVNAVGRLDRATSGLLLFTNDTRLADWLCDPRNALPRRYAVTVRGWVSDESLARIVRGFVDRGDALRARSALLRKRSRRESHLLLELEEGKNREVRRLFEACGHEVTRLARVAFGALELGTLRVGAQRAIDEEELAAAFPGAPLRRGGARGPKRGRAG